MPSSSSPAVRYAELLAEANQIRGVSLWQDAWRRLKRNWMAMMGFVLATSTPIWAQDKSQDDAKKAAPPAAAATSAAPAKADAKKAEKPKKELSDAQKAEQARKTACNAEAGERKGDDRKKFTEACQNNMKKAQQERMKSCSKEVADKKLKGDDRKAFMNTCLPAKK